MKYTKIIYAECILNESSLIKSKNIYVHKLIYIGAKLVLGIYRLYICINSYLGTCIQYTVQYIYVYIYIYGLEYWLYKAESTICNSWELQEPVLNSICATQKLLEAIIH